MINKYLQIFKYKIMKRPKCYIMHCLLAIIGLILLIFFVIGTYFTVGFLGVHNPIFFLHSANSFFLLCIVSKILCKCHCTCKDENSNTEKKA